MKFIAFCEYDPKDFDKVIEKFRQAMAEREKGTGKFPKQLFPAHSFGGLPKVIVILENPTEEQLNNLVAHYMPEMKIELVPLLDAETFIPTYMKMKK